MSKKPSAKPRPVLVRCAIYTRKSTEEGLNQEFNSLDAQREAGEAYIASQQHEGWGCLPDRYDDGGFTGGNLERPAMKRLMADIEAGKIDCVVVYKVDRLSRSLLDFARIMEVFDKRKIAFVSVTQQFNTATSMGRLVLNVLLSFAQFEREIIGERIRDKLAAQKRKGKWTGGFPILGYDVDRSGPSPKLVVNAVEAARVRHIFELYLSKGSLLPVVDALARKGWTTKSWKTRAGNPKGGLPFDRGNLHQLLKNPLYIGKIQHKNALHVGEHEAIVSPDVFQAVQSMMAHNRRTGGVEFRNRYGALLRRLLQCKGCGHAMVHNFTGKKGRNYRYYTCTTSIKSGVATCPTGYVPAAEIERVVIERIRAIAGDEALIAEVVHQAQAAAARERENLEKEQAGLERELLRHQSELRKLTGAGPASEHALTQIATLNEQAARAETRLAEVNVEIAKRERGHLEAEDVKAAFKSFDSVWNSLTPREQAQAVALLVQRVEFDATDSTLSITFYPAAIKSMPDENQEDVA
jgi:site-specific DNA recombinase